MHTKTAIVTGASSGIGLAIAKKLLAHGFTVHNWDIQETPESRETDAIFHRTDITSIANIELNVRAFVKAHDALDLLVCNAGIHRRNSLRDITEAEWDLVQQTNVKGVVFTVKHCLDSLIAAKKAKVVIIGSDQCFIAKPQSLAYGASKGALGQLTKYLALELAEHGICVNTVCPATIDTPLARRAFTGLAEAEFGGDMEQALAWEASHYPLKKIGTGEDVAEMVYYLGTFENTFTTGGLFKIDGGLTLS